VRTKSGSSYIVQSGTVNALPFILANSLRSTPLLCRNLAKGQANPAVISAFAYSSGVLPVLIAYRCGSFPGWSS
jgi:hypothetical protein